ncbi:presequence protease, mitochondrial-like [Drosophila nasuta]|uniref:presequence protease, mitochondrial-like n=1 Tax=Drosophila nasuta TaxID=42062 RepID=UPI00295EFE64|nr:presequence protease, mitochondrial-like [Drosophila nasuta]
MLRRLNYIKSVQQPMARVLHIKSPLQNSTPVEHIVSSAKVKTDIGIDRDIPYIIDGQNYRYKEGHVYQGFRCERVESIPDYGLMSCTLRHLGTGTEFWYLDRNHIENSFSIHFRTTPFNSTGLPHILEHLTLAGSKKYPVRDPFFKMRNRSVATFMNAMTGPDYTIYPVSSMNEVDFRNLQMIYMDAVFRPNLLYLDFLQEGWRLEHKDVHDRNSDIVFKGVVYNEMMGAYADNNILLKQKMLNNILPSHAYGHMGAGNALEMPKLTHEDLVNYHRQYYHPSNARIFCYGSFDLEKTLEFVDKEYLSHYDRMDSSFSCIPSEKRWSEPRRVCIQGRPDTMGPSIDRQNQIAIGLLLCDITDIQENFELKILAELLIRGPNSPFYKSMVEPNFSGGYIRWTGHVPNRKDTYFTVGLQHVSEDDLELFEELFDNTLHKASIEGFDSQHIESVLCNYELTLKQQSECRHLLYKSIVLWNHDGDVVSNLRISELFSKLRNKLKDNPNYFKQKIEKYYINNPHKLIITMRPNECQEIERQLSESKLLLKKLKETSDEEFEQIYENGLKLEAFQKAPQDIEVLPCLSINDVQKPFPRPQMNELTLRGVPTLISHEPLAGITYLNCMFNTTGLSLNDSMLLPLFCSVVSEMGTSNHDYRQFDNLVRSKMARIVFTPKVVESVTDGKSYHLGLLMKTYAVDKNVDLMFRLCEELLLNFRLDDTDRLKMLIKNYISKFSLNVRSNGHLYAMMGSSALVTNAGRLKSLLTGVDHVDYMKKYVKENSIEAIRDSLKSIGSKVFSRNNLRVAINTSENNVSSILGNYERFLTHLPTQHQMINTKEIFLQEPSFRHYNLDMPLNFCSKTIFAVPYVHEDHAALRVLAKILTAKYLLPVVREQNGAYGAGAKIGFDGLFNFFSYRDPHSAKTIEVFDKTYEWLQTGNCKIDQQAIFEAKLAVLQLVDWPIAPGEINSDSFVLGATYDIYFNYRARVLAVTVNEVLNVIEKYFKNESKHFGKCVIGRKSVEIEVDDESDETSEMSN